jgi:hypothetical protein
MEHCDSLPFTPEAYPPKANPKTAQSITMKIIAQSAILLLFLGALKSVERQGV